jgi:organic radical activating enzyme
MTKLIEIKRVRDVLSVYWTLTDFCNFRCNYCPSNLHSGDFKSGRKPGYPTDDEIRTFLDRLINVHAKGKFLHVCISGGEPTLHPMYEEIINTLHSHGLVETITNGTRSIDWWKQLKHLPDKTTMSLHAGWTKIDKVNELGEFLLDNNVYVNYNMMCDPGNWDSVQEMYKQLTPRLQALVNAKIITNHVDGSTDGQPWEYYPEQIEYIKSIASSVDQPERRFSDVNLSSMMVYDDESSSKLGSPFAIINNNQHNFRGWECSAGSEGITISFDGFAYASNCRSILMGRINNFNLFQSPITCNRNWCKCGIDIPLTKKKPISLLDQ